MQVGFGLYPVVVKVFAEEEKADPIIFSFYRQVLISVSLVPRPLPDFISQKMPRLLDKIWEWAGGEARFLYVKSNESDDPLLLLCPVMSAVAQYCLSVPSLQNANSSYPV